MCHLTATGQTSFNDEDSGGYIEQACKVFAEYKKSGQIAKNVHFSFMARGEALANKYLLKDADSILMSLGNLAKMENLNPKFNISTIMPASLHEKKLTDIFKIITPTIYYSAYSFDEDFRKKWLPAAMDFKKALELLREYQDVSKKIIKIHYALIKGENDDTGNARNIAAWLNDYNIAYEVNLVRYNPFSLEQGVEADEEAYQNHLEVFLESGAHYEKIIKRVGFDVKASCGMFVEKA
jgi:adenine C2-methylase RlmN of 23S rRNA A2503 and tRNA A37